MLVKIGEMLLLAFGERPHARCSRRGAAQDPAVFEMNGDRGPRSVLELAFHKRGIQSCRSEEHTSELQSLMRISYAVFCLKKKIATKRQASHARRSKHTLLRLDHHDC